MTASGGPVGGAADGRSAPPALPHRSSSRLLALHALRLRGVADVEDIASYMLVAPEPIGEALDRLDRDGLVEFRPGRIRGYTHTAEGRTEAEAIVATELDDLGLRDRVQAAHAAFLGFNRAVLDVCTRWQLRTIDGELHANDHGDPDHDEAVFRDLRSLHSGAERVVDDLAGMLARFDGHGRRLRYALDQIAAGQHDYLTKPMFPSYHASWFELHEDLLATLGIERAHEGDQ